MRFVHLVRLVAALLRALLAAAAHALSPPTCAACDAPTPPFAVFCAGCARTVERRRGEPARTASGPAAAAPTVAFATFGGALSAAIHRLKYSDRPDLARPLGHLLRRAARDAGICGDIVVPVPLHARRLAERGYNQSALLAAHVAAELDAPLAPRALRRRRPTHQQARLARDQRLGNVAGAFSVRDPARIRGLRVVLIDDVATTGATLSACRSALIEAGAASVTCLVLAQAAWAAQAPFATALRTKAR